jgi:hypothetical protein
LPLCSTRWYLYCAICCSQICLPFTYLGKPKGEALPVLTKNFYFWVPPKNICFVWWANQNDSLRPKKKRKVELVSTPIWLVETWIHVCYIGVYGMICTHGFQIALCLFLAVAFRIIYFHHTKVGPMCFHPLLFSFVVISNKHMTPSQQYPPPPLNQSAWRKLEKEWHLQMLLFMLSF